MRKCNYVFLCFECLNLFLLLFFLSKLFKFLEILIIIDLSVRCFVNKAPTSSIQYLGYTETMRFIIIDS